MKTHLTAILSTTNPTVSLICGIATKAIHKKKEREKQKRKQQYFLIIIDQNYQKEQNGYYH
jgi:hypothetical protein